MAQLTRRSLLAGLSAFAAAPALSETVWPNRPILLMHGFPAGGPVDTVSRILADALSKRLGQQIVVEAKSGATGTIAAGQVAQAKPDGYTITTIPATFPATAVMFRSLPYRPLDDFSFISTTAEYPFVIATRAGHRIESLADLVRLARSQSAPLQYATAGIGSIQHLTMELLAAAAEIHLQHIPYRGGAPALLDLLGGQVDLLIDPPTTLVSLVAEGKIRVLAVTGPERFPALPNVPTIAESGFPGFVATGYQGLAGPAGLSSAIVQKLHGHIVAVLSDAKVVEQLRKIGNVARASTPEEFKARLSADIAKWSRVVEQAKIERI